MIKPMSLVVRISVAMAGVGCVAGAALATPAAPSAAVLKVAVTHYLQDHGDLCVGKVSWPRDVSDADRQASSNDAVQLPVLQRLGLVQSQVLPGSAHITRYSLTDKGRQFYLHKKRTTLGAHDQPVEQDADLCVARLSLDKVVKWTPPAQTHGHRESVVWYTYHIQAAGWMADPQARKVFPVVDEIIRGQGHLLMTATVKEQAGSWVPVLPGQ